MINLWIWASLHSYIHSFVFITSLGSPLNLPLGCCYSLSQNSFSHLLAAMIPFFPAMILQQQILLLLSVLTGVSFFFALNNCIPTWTIITLHKGKICFRFSPSNEQQIFFRGHWYITCTRSNSNTLVHDANHWSWGHCWVLKVNKYA